MAEKRAGGRRQGPLSPCRIAWNQFVPSRPYPVSIQLPWRNQAIVRLFNEQPLTCQRTLCDHTRKGKNRSPITPQIPCSNGQLHSKRPGNALVELLEKGACAA